MFMPVTPRHQEKFVLCSGNALYFKSARNVTVNILNDQTKVLTRLVTGPKAVEAYGKKFEVKTVSGKLLFSADDSEVVVGAERLRVLGAEGTVFPKSIETPNVRADPFKELSFLQIDRIRKQITIDMDQLPQKYYLKEVCF
ncbi:Delta-sarcoglycan [Cricetulus griseus]|uniref:Delta-sarcoglycan n=1 Tax=Cricetulus griseus TaxID=10029 RepID=G3I3C1_CRIGR|nr:Delta-sarcoglycan [Cricetulus griseus]ERE68982.1 delta-sarcoglycan-like protein [Cricetulus griseus]